MAEILAIAHPDGGTVGVLAEAASEQSLAIEHWIPAEGGEPQRPLDQYSGLVVLGGDENIDQVDRYPYLEREYEIVNDWIEADRPLFGVCLGAQMIAHVSGGSVFKASKREFGWEQIDVLPAGRDDPVTGFGADTLIGLAWHDYAFEPPPGSTTLASNSVCIQAFRYGEAWGFQHHPEIEGSVLDHWLAPLLADASDPARRDQAELVEAGRAAHMQEWNEYGRELFRRFAKRCR